MLNRLRVRSGQTPRCETVAVSARSRRWQVLSHLREPERVDGSTRRTGVGGRAVFVAPEGHVAPPEVGTPMSLDAIRAISRVDLPAWIERFRSAGIAADRVTSPDLLRQLDQSSRRPIHAVVCNALDPDPQSDLQLQLAIEFPDELYAAMLGLTRLLGTRRALACFPGDDLPRGRLAERFCRDPDRELAVRCLRNVYPISEPSLLLLQLFQSRLPPGSLPTSVGVLLLDAAAAVQLGRFLLAGEPALTVRVLVRHWHREPVVVEATIGCTLGDVLDAAGTPWDGQQLRAGAELRRAVAHRDDIVGPGEHVVHVIPPDEAISPTVCVRCGWCGDVCPTRALPAGLLEAAQRDDRSLADRYGLDACVGCGLCSQVCPSRLPLLPAIMRLRRETSPATREFA